ncbi:MAG: dihydrodipicolinate synthase family protein [Thermomicrobiales bacterium]
MLTVKEAKTRWRGVLAPIVTPFGEDGELNLDALQTNVQWLLDRGATRGNTVFLAAGSGGDFPMMNLHERQQVITAIADVVDGKAPIIAGVQSLDIRETIALCQHCERLGLDGVQISVPFYYDGRQGDVIAWFEEVARHTNVGFAIYNNWYTGYDMPLSLVEELLDLPNAIGVKWASPSIDVFQDGVRRLLPHVAVVNNTFNTILGHLLGSRCFVSHWPNFYPEWCWRIWDLMETGQYLDAQHEFDRVMAPYQALVAQIATQTAGEGVFVRPLMAAAGLNGGYSRLPSRDAAVTAEMHTAFRSLLAATDTAVSEIENTAIDGLGARYKGAVMPHGGVS